MKYLRKRNMYMKLNFTLFIKTILIREDIDEIYMKIFKIIIILFRILTVMNELRFHEETCLNS